MFPAEIIPHILSLCQSSLQWVRPIEAPRDASIPRIKSVTTTTAAAWESTTWYWNDLGHGAGEFFTSPGVAGLAALVAAGVAAWQGSKTRAQDIEDRRADREIEESSRKLTDLWKRFEWVVDRSAAKSDQTESALDETQAATMLVSISSAAKELGDTHLVGMITTYMSEQIEDLDIGE